MSDLSFGLIMMVTGMGVTFFTLYLLTLVIRLLTLLFPNKQEAKEKSQTGRTPSAK